MFTVLSKHFLILEQERAKEYILPDEKTFDSMDAKHIRYAFNRGHTFVKHTKIESGTKTGIVFATIFLNDNPKGITEIRTSNDVIITIDGKKNTITSRVSSATENSKLLDETGCRNFLKKCLYGTKDYKASLEEGTLTTEGSVNCDCPGVSPDAKTRETIQRNSGKGKIKPRTILEIKPLKPDAVKKPEKTIRA